MVESIKNAYNNQGVDAARQLYFEIKNILDTHHHTLVFEKLNRDLEDYYPKIIIGGKRKTRRKKRRQSRSK
jgi:retron-type reverse transcriptase